jgi:lipoprotein-anchoring transpeptidase ErfK/SrfK
MPPQNTKLGGEIYIHGHGAGSDWTWGCVALENEDVKELYEAVSMGTTVTILP